MSRMEVFFVTYTALFSLKDLKSILKSKLLYTIYVLSLDEEMQKMRKFPLLNQNKMQDEVCAWIQERRELYLIVSDISMSCKSSLNRLCFTILPQWVSQVWGWGWGKTGGLRQELHWIFTVGQNTWQNYESKYWIKTEDTSPSNLGHRCKSSVGSTFQS